MKKCIECGNEFEPKNPKGKFCSPICRQKNYRKNVAVLLVKARGIEFKPTTPESYDAPKMSNYILDEVGQTAPAPELTYEEKRMLERILILNKELANPPKDPIIGQSRWIAVRQKELKELQAKLKP